MSLTTFLGHSYFGLRDLDSKAPALEIGTFPREVRVRGKDQANTKLGQTAVANPCKKF